MKSTSLVSWSLHFGLELWYLVYITSLTQFAKCGGMVKFRFKQRFKKVVERSEATETAVPPRKSWNMCRSNALSCQLSHLFYFFLSVYYFTSLSILNANELQSIKQICVCGRKKFEVVNMRASSHFLLHLFGFSAVLNFDPYIFVLGCCKTCPVNTFCGLRHCP